MKFEVTSSPHIRSKKNTGSIMLDVIIALIPALPSWESQGPLFPH